MVIAGGGAAQPLNDTAVRAAQARVAADGTIQFQLPAAERPEPPAWLIWLIQHLKALGSAGEILFWLLVAAGVVLLATLMVRAVLRWRNRETGPDPVVADWRPEAAAARALLADADRLAADGRFDEAARLLLHRSLEEIGEHRPALVRPAATAREIGGARNLPVAVKLTFAPIAAAVERSLFGGRSLQRSDWDIARDAYRRFALPGAWA